MEQDWCWDIKKLGQKKKFRGRESNSEFQWGRMSYWYGDTETCLLIKQGEPKLSFKFDSIFILKRFELETTSCNGE